MAKFDFLNKNYTFEEMVDGFTDGDIKNFENDEGFLEFLMYYAIGNYLEGNINEELKKKYAAYEGLLNLALLDEYDIRGKKLYAIYKICGKDKMKFIRTLHHIGKICSFHQTFSKEDILTNLSLMNPVDFIDETILFPGNINPASVFEAGFSVNPYDVDYEDKKEYDHELRRSLIKRINESIRSNHDNVSMLPEIKSYKEEQEEKDEKIKNSMVPDDYKIKITNLYFGTENIDASGGVLNMNMKVVSWFEDTFIKFGNYSVFRSIPAGDYCLIDAAGNIFIPEEKIEINSISILPTSTIRFVQISSILLILMEAIKLFEEDPVQNEIALANINGLLEILNTKEELSVAELKDYQSIVRDCYELVYGEIFPRSGETPKL